jgi:hypothetical protein
MYASTHPGEEIMHVCECGARHRIHQFEATLVSKPANVHPVRLVNKQQEMDLYD